MEPSSRPPPRRSPPYISLYLPISQARGAHLLSTCRAAQRLHGGAHVADGVDAGEGGTADSSADIFRGEVAAEMARLEKVLADLAAAGRALLEQWPGHPALQSLHEVRAA